MGYQTTSGPHQTAAPELPRPFVNPSGACLEHDVGKEIAAKRLLQSTHLIEPGHAHRLGKNSGV